MQNTTNLFNNYQLNNLQKENSNLNYSEFINGETILKSYPRRLIIQLYSRSNENIQSQYFSLSLMNTIRPSLSFAEEIVLISSETRDIHTNLQAVLHFADDFQINKSLSVNISALKEISPWVFQYNVSKVNINIGDDINSFITMLETSSPLRELIVRKYFAHVKPYITITANISKSNNIHLEKLVDVVSDIGVDRLVLHTLKNTNNSEQKYIFKTKDEHATVFSSIVNRAEMYGIDISIPDHGIDCNNELYFYPLWSDLFISPGGALRSFCLADDQIMNLPALGSSFIPDIWNADAVLKTRHKKTNPGDMTVTDRAICNREIYIFRDSIDI